MQKQVQMRKKKSITLSSKPTYQGYSHGFKIAMSRTNIALHFLNLDTSPISLIKQIVVRGHIPRNDFSKKRD